MKKKLFICAILVIAISIAAYGTSAYFTYEDTATNVITTGNLSIAIREWMLPEDGGERIPYEDPREIMPGMEISKIVTVENTGDQPAWIRVRLEKSITLADGIEAEADLSLMQYVLNEADWTERDGWYYYGKPLAAGETTEPLLTAVTIAEEMGNLYQNCEATVDVKAQATQTANNGTDALDAAGWPEE